MCARKARKQVLSSLHPVVSERLARFGIKLVDRVLPEAVQRANDAVLGELYQNIW